MSTAIVRTRESLLLKISEAESEVSTKEGDGKLGHSGEISKGDHLYEEPIPVPFSQSFDSKGGSNDSPSQGGISGRDLFDPPSQGGNSGRDSTDPPSRGGNSGRDSNDPPLQGGNSGGSGGSGDDPNDPETADLTSPRRNAFREWILFVQDVQEQCNVRCVTSSRLLENVFSILSSLRSELRAQYARVFELNGFNSRVERQFHDCRLLLSEALSEITSRLEDKKNVIDLPRIELVKFNGDPQNWVSFRQLFEEMVHKRHDISDVKKMSYLRSNVSGEAWDAIKHFRADLRDSYSKAWKCLNERFSNKRKIVQAEVEALFNLPKANSAKTFKTFYSILVDSLESLSNLGIDVSSWDPLLNRLILPKWDPETSQLFEQRLEDAKEVPNIDVIRNFLLWRIDTFQPAALGEMKVPKKVFATTSKKSKKSRNSKKVGVSCYKCQQTHALWQCPDFLGISVKDRVTFVDGLNLCRVCLSHETSKKCRSTYKCIECEGKHSKLLHPPIKPVLLTQSVSECLFPTTVVMLEETGQSVIAIVDQCADANFVNRDIVHKLNLTTQPISSGFSGLNNETTAISEKVTITIRDRHGKNPMTIDALVLDSKIRRCPEVPIQRISVFEPLDLANPAYHVPTDILMLLGNKFYTKIMKGNLKKIESTVAQLSTFGWLISGEVVGLDTAQPDDKF